MKRVGVFRTVFPNPSDVFVYQQACNYRTYRPTLLVRTKLSTIDIETIAISDEDKMGFRQRIYSLTASPSYFIKEAKGVDIIHAHFGTDSIYGLEIAKALDIPLVVTFHGSDITTSRISLALSGKPSVYHFLTREKELMSYASKFIAVSDFIKARLIERGYPENKVIRSYIGVNTDIFRPQAPPFVDRYILNVARHVSVKGIDVLLRAFALISSTHPTTRLVQIGGGPETEALKRLTRELGLESRVTFLGPRSHGEVLKFMQEAEAFVLPSRSCANGQTEALGIVLNEASACGVPVIGTLSGGIGEAIIDGRTGYLVPEQDPGTLAQRLGQILGSPELKRQLGSNGRNLVCERFDIKKQTEELEKIYDAVLEE